MFDINVAIESLILGFTGDTGPKECSKLEKMLD